MPPDWDVEADVIVVGFGPRAPARPWRRPRPAARCWCSTGSAAVVPPRCPAVSCTPAAARRSSARPVTGPGGRVTGVECVSLRGAPAVAHRVLHRWSVRPYLYAPKADRCCTGRPAGWSEGTAVRCGRARPAAWCWRPAAIGDAVVLRGGRAWLLVDRVTAGPAATPRWPRP